MLLSSHNIIYGISFHNTSIGGLHFGNSEFRYIRFPQVHLHIRRNMMTSSRVIMSSTDVAPAIIPPVRNYHVYSFVRHTTKEAAQLNSNAPKVPQGKQQGLSLHPEIAKEICNNDGCLDQACPKLCEKIVPVDWNDINNKLPIATTRIIGHRTTNAEPLPEHEQKTKIKYEAPFFSRNGKGSFTVLYKTTVPVEDLSKHGKRDKNNVFSNGDNWKKIEELLDEHNKIIEDPNKIIEQYNKLTQQHSKLMQQHKTATNKHNNNK